MSGATTTGRSELLPVVQPIRAPRRWNLGLLASALVAIGCTLGLLIAVNRYAATESYLVLTRDLPAGALLTADDLRVEQGRLSPATFAAVVAATEQHRVVGQRLTTPAFANSPLLRAQLTEQQGLRLGLVAMAIPVKPENAVGGRLRQGDTVRILATRNKGKSDSQTTVLVDAAMVQAIGRERRIGTTGLGVSAADAASANADSPVIWLTLLIGEEIALELSNARWNGDLDIVLLPPAGTGSGEPDQADGR